MNPVKLYGYIDSVKANDIVSQFENAHPDGDSYTLVINSPGGDVMAGETIISEIKLLQADGYKVNALIVGNAFSMAAVIANSCDMTRIMNYGLMMFHPPMSSAKGKKANDVISLFTNKLQLIVDKRKMNITPQDLMSAENYFSAEQCLALGIVDEVISEIDIYNAFSEAFRAKEEEIEDFLTENNQTEIEQMTNANQIDIENAERITVLNAENVQLKAERNALLKAGAIAILRNAKEKGKIISEAEDFYPTIEAVVNTGGLESLQKLVDALPEPYKGGAVRIANNDIQNNGNSSIWNEDWSYSDYQKKDPKGLAEIMRNHNDIFQAKFNEFLTKNK